MAKYYNTNNRTIFYKERFDKQQGCCALCGRKERLVIDHDYKSGHMRGLLCYKHNSALGFFEDDIGLLNRAIAYLQESKPKVNLAIVSDKKNEDRQKQIKLLLVELVSDTSFYSDRARARELADKTGLLPHTAYTKIRRYKIKQKLDKLAQK